MELDAVIFDMDGVLVDTMPYHARAWVKALGERGVRILPSVIYEMEGANHEGILRTLYRRRGVGLTEEDIKAISQRKTQIFDEISNLKVFPGVKSLLTLLQDRLKLAVVSGSDRKTVNRILNTCFPGIFQTVVTGSDVGSGKPDPESYLLALEKLGTAREKTIVVENSPRGVESAKRAGLKVIAIPTYLHPRKLKRADIIIPSHSQLEKQLLDP